MLRGAFDERGHAGECAGHHLIEQRDLIALGEAFGAERLQECVLGFQPLQQCGGPGGARRPARCCASARWPPTARRCVSSASARRARTRSASTIAARARSRATVAVSPHIKHERDERDDRRIHLPRLQVIERNEASRRPVCPVVGDGVDLPRHPGGDVRRAVPGRWSCHRARCRPRWRGRPRSGPAAPREGHCAIAAGGASGAGRGQSVDAHSWWPFTTVRLAMP